MEIILQFSPHIFSYIFLYNEYLYNEYLQNSANIDISAHKFSRYKILQITFHSALKFTRIQFFLFCVKMCTFPSHDFHICARFFNISKKTLQNSIQKCIISHRLFSKISRHFSQTQIIKKN